MVMPVSQSAELIQVISLFLIIFGTAAAALALPVVRRSLSEKVDSVADYFYGDRKPETASNVSNETQTLKQETTNNQATSRREMDNFDLSIFEEF
jgi:hypothetical protein